MTRMARLLVAATAMIALTSTPTNASPPAATSQLSVEPPPSCGGDAGGRSARGGFQGYGQHGCGGLPRSDTSSSSGTTGSKPAWVVRTVDCGPRRARGHVLSPASGVCLNVINECALGAGVRPSADPFATTVGTERVWPDGRWLYLGANCNARTNRPQLTPLLVRQQVEKLVPHPGIGVAPPGGRTLVNLQTVLWSDTPRDRSLGTVRLLGIYRVALRVHVRQVVWEFGDGASARTGSPGRPYRVGEHCATVSCPGHFGHVYARTGSMTITSRVSWTGQYSVNGGRWQTIAGAVTGPQAAAQVTVVQARGVLVADPSPH